MYAAAVNVRVSITLLHAHFLLQELCARGSQAWVTIISQISQLINCHWKDFCPISRTSWSSTFFQLFNNFGCQKELHVQTAVMPCFWSLFSYTAVTELHRCGPQFLRSYSNQETFWEWPRDQFRNSERKQPTDRTHSSSLIQSPSAEIQATHPHFLLTDTQHEQ